MCTGEKEPKVNVGVVVDTVSFFFFLQNSKLVGRQLFNRKALVQYNLLTYSSPFLQNF